MDPIYRLPPSPGTPLFPISPNRQQLPLMQSPSLPTNVADHINDPFYSGLSSRASFGVQDKVAQFNNLTKENESPRHRERDAALRRAMLGREEAETEIRRLRDESRALRREVEEGKQREMKVGARLEAVMEDLVREKESMVHAQTLYEKQIRQARKEAFKSSSTVLKMREEVKTSRNQATLRREEVDEQKRLVEDKDKALFTAQYQQVGLQEEIDALKHQLETAEEEMTALKSSLQEEELARIAVEGKLALPPSSDQDEMEEEKKPSSERRESLKENVDPIPSKSPVDEQVLGELTMLRRALLAEQRLREQTQDGINFMRMECQLRCCSCRLAEKRGHSYVYDTTFDKTQELNAGSKRRSGNHQACAKRSRPNEAEDAVLQQVNQPVEVEPLIMFSPTSGTFQKTVTMAEEPPEALETHSAIRSATPPSHPAETHDLSTINESPTQAPPSRDMLPAPPAPSSRPRTPPHMFSTTTTQVPIAPVVLTPARPPTNIPFSPDVTMTREEALEQIRQRRGRARSVTAGPSTTRRHFSAPKESRRDISAPAKTPSR